MSVSGKQGNKPEYENLHRTKSLGAYSNQNEYIKDQLALLDLVLKKVISVRQDGEKMPEKGGGYARADLDTVYPPSIPAGGISGDGREITQAINYIQKG